MYEQNRPAWGRTRHPGPARGGAWPAPRGDSVLPLQLPSQARCPWNAARDGWKVPERGEDAWRCGWNCPLPAEQPRGPSGFFPGLIVWLRVGLWARTPSEPATGLGRGLSLPSFLPTPTPSPSGVCCLQASPQRGTGQAASSLGASPFSPTAWGALNGGDRQGPAAQGRRQTRGGGGRV